MCSALESLICVLSVTGWRRCVSRTGNNQRAPVAPHGDEREDNEPAPYRSVKIYASPNGVMDVHEHHRPTQHMNVNLE